MRKHYSRLANVEEKRNIKKAYWYIVLSITAVLVLFFLGLPSLIRFAGFVGEIGKSASPVDNNDITPPAPPSIDSSTEYTNNKEYDIAGVSESGATVTLNFNDKESSVVTNSEGRFSFDVTLLEGGNEFSLRAKDQAGNESQTTQVYKLIFDDEAPELTINTPKDGAQFYGPGQKQLTIEGTTSDDAEVYINERFVTVNEELNFSYTTTLSEGENKFDLKAVDQAANETTSTLTVNFSPS